MAHPRTPPAFGRPTERDADRSRHAWRQGWSHQLARSTNCRPTAKAHYEARGVNRRGLLSFSQVSTSPLSDLLIKLPRMPSVRSAPAARIRLGLTVTGNALELSREHSAKEGWDEL